MDAPNPDTASTQTDIEKAKLARRQAEYAVLTDALRRGIPAIYIPFLVAAASAPREIPGHAADRCTPARGGYAYAYAYASGDGDRVYPHLRGGYRVPVSVGMLSVRQREHEHAQPVVYRRVQLDDSFLRRAYKRRSWSSEGRARAGLGAAMSTAASASASASASARQVYFHHWLPGGRKTRRRS